MGFGVWGFDASQDGRRPEQGFGIETLHSSARSSPGSGGAWSGFALGRLVCWALLGLRFGLFLCLLLVGFPVPVLFS